jgi:hypothetical protein
MTSHTPKLSLRIRARRAFCVITSRHLVGGLGLLAMAEAAHEPSTVLSTMNVRGLVFHVTSKVTADQIDVEMLALGPVRLVRCTLSRVSPGQWRLHTQVGCKGHPLAMNWFTPAEQEALVDIVGSDYEDSEWAPQEDDGTLMIFDIVVPTTKMSLREKLARVTSLQGGQ